MTRRAKSDRICKLSGSGKRITNELEKNSKNFEKSFKKVLTSEKRCDIIIKLSRERELRKKVFEN